MEQVKGQENKDEVKGLLFTIFELGFRMRGWTGDYAKLPMQIKHGDSNPMIVFSLREGKRYSACCEAGDLISREELIENAVFLYLIEFNEFLEKLNPDVLKLYKEMHVTYCTPPHALNENEFLHEMIESVSIGMAYCYCVSTSLIQTSIYYSKELLGENIFELEIEDIKNFVITRQE